MQTLRVGDIVRFKKNAPWNAGQVGFVYETYKDFDDGSKLGAQIITRTGNDLGGFSFQEQEKFLDFEAHSDFDYEFKSVLRLDDDYRHGLFDRVFKQYV